MHVCYEEAHQRLKEKEQKKLKYFLIGAITIAIISLSLFVNERQKFSQLTEQAIQIFEENKRNDFTECAANC